jgi:spore coat protein A, manganese oxidase
MLTRRQLLQRGAVGGTALAFMRVPFAPSAVAATPKLSRFTEPLPIPPVLDGTGGGKSFTIAARDSMWQFHAKLPPTRTWGYWDTGSGKGIGYLGPTIEATRRPSDTVAATQLTVRWVNELDKAFLPNDPTLMGAVLPGEPVPIVTHLHGGENHPQFDGTPLQWFTTGGQKGPHFITDTYTYYNEQLASMVWYHDHALGNTRTNVYAGLAGIYFIRDAKDTGRPDNPLGLPAGDYEIPLVLQDKTFNADGSLFYPTVGVVPSVHPHWVPEFFGDVAVVNAKSAPFAAVEPRRYRLRIVNGSQARFFNLKFTNTKNGKIQTFHQVGTDGGLLRAPVAMTKLLLAPGERADVIVDFAGLQGAQIQLKNDAKAPYPMGRGGGVVHLMAFNVTKPLNGTDATTPAASLKLPDIPALPDPSVTRVQHLSETLDPITGAPLNLNVEDKPYLNAAGLPDVTTKPLANAVEDWLLVNTTADTHPIHLHLVTFEVKHRRPFSVATYNAGGGIVYTGAPVPAMPNENGRKDTVQAHPGQVTRIRARFELPDEGTIQVPIGVTNPQYVWHCHILEHEENDMMRAFEVVQ